MFEQVFENLRKATETAIQAQQEMFRTWVDRWTGVPGQPQAIQKKWADTFGELLKKQREALEAQFNAGLKMIEDACAVSTAKPEEIRDKLIANWKRYFEGQRQLLGAPTQWVADLWDDAGNWWLFSHHDQ